MSQLIFNQLRSVVFLEMIASFRFLDAKRFDLSFTHNYLHNQLTKIFPSTMKFVIEFLFLYFPIQNSQCLLYLARLSINPLATWEYEA